MKFILGTKKEMTRKFKDSGEIVPVTVVCAGPCFVTQVKTKEKDGYSAIQVGFGEKKKLKKPLSGHLKNLGKFRWLKEFKIDENTEVNRGQKFDASIFNLGDIVDVAGTSIGRGFQGVVKRHDFAGGHASHGHKDQLRMPGSIGAGGPGRVFKGRRMAGRMGDEKTTIKNLEILDIDKDNNLIYIKGAVPGARGSFIEIKAKGDMKFEKIIEEKPAFAKATAGEEEKKDNQEKEKTQVLEEQKTEEKIQEKKD